MRDWGSLRDREWKPLPPRDEDGAAASDAAAPRGAAGQASSPPAAQAPPPHRGARAAAAAGGGGSPAGGRPAGAREWLTDEAISAGKVRAGQPRELQRWEDSSAPAEGGLLELEKSSRLSRQGQQGDAGKWDQFKVNYELFGVVSTFKDDLSQYTTPLRKDKITPEMRRKADRLAQEIEKGASARGQTWNDAFSDGEGGDGENEEDLFSACPRNYGDAGAASSYQHPAGQKQTWRPAKAPEEEMPKAEPTTVGGALLGMLRAGAPSGTEAAQGDYRTQVAPKVQAWWRARRQAGDAVPPGAEAGLVCPFSLRVFGDATQLLMHWAAALPRPEAPTASPAATAQFRAAGGELRWADLVAATAGVAAALPVEMPRAGSVWEQVLTRMRPAADEPKQHLPVGDFVASAVAIKCWRRDQKVEHREVLEALAAGLAFHVLASGRAWTPDP